MKKLVLLLLVGPLAAIADTPDQQSLIEAWERYMAGLPSTVEFEKTGDRRYRLEDSDFSYAGELELTSALVRPSETYGEAADFTHFGIVEFRLAELDPERLATQAYYYWLSDRQTLHYSSELDAWLGPAAYRASFMRDGNSAISLGPLQFMLNYGIWIFLIGLIVFLFIVLGRQTKKARSLMDDSAAINEQARKNIERAAELQDEMIDLTRQSQELQKQSNALLERIASAVEKRG